MNITSILKMKIDVRLKDVALQRCEIGSGLVRVCYDMPFTACLETLPYLACQAKK